MKQCFVSHYGFRLNATCVIYEGIDLPNTGINTYDNIETVIQKINNSFSTSGSGGTSGTSATSGTTGTSGTSATSGSSGSSSTSGTSGSSIPSGTYVPYIGAIGAVDLGAYDLTVNGITAGLGPGLVNYNNTVFGDSVLLNQVSGDVNSVFGYHALLNSLHSNNNSAFGAYALLNTEGTDNAVFGNAMIYATTANFNVAVGSEAGSTLGNYFTHLNNIEYSTFIGYRTTAYADNDTNEVVIGANAIGHGSNTATWGNTSIVNHYFNGKLSLNTSGTAAILNVKQGASDGIGIRISRDQANGNPVLQFSDDVTYSNQITLIAGTDNLSIAPYTGNVGIGNVAPGNYKLNVSGEVLATKFNLSTLNTAPSTSSDTGTLGEIRITNDYFYFCIAANTWVRCSITTW